MLSNFDIEGHCTKLRLPLVGAFSKDSTPRKKPKQERLARAINLQGATDEHGQPLPGTHWTAFYIEKRRAVYFDSFGFIYPKQVDTFLKQYKPVLYNKRDIQNTRSGVCGCYCIYFLWFTFNNRKRVPDIHKRCALFLSKFSDDVTKNQAKLESLTKPL